jgi:hypothetical protein
MEEVVGSIPTRSTKSFTSHILATVNGNLSYEVDRFHGRTFPANSPEKDNSFATFRRVPLRCTGELGRLLHPPLSGRGQVFQSGVLQRIEELRSGGLALVTVNTRGRAVCHPEGLTGKPISLDGSHYNSC